MVEKLCSSKKPEVSQWGGIIREYCQNYEDKLRVSFLKDVQYIKIFNRRGLTWTLTARNIVKIS